MPCGNFHQSTILHSHPPIIRAQCHLNTKREKKITVMNRSLRKTLRLTHRLWRVC
ncbi:hypothetical protein RSAG8_09722, partial [Rhizoctonia solani AG-8 WAC10335]